VTTVLDAATRALVRVAVGLPNATEVQLVDWMRRAREDGASTIWLEELLLSSVLYVGFPRALVAAAVFRRLEADPASGGEVAQYDHWREWLERGEATCRVIYGKHYDQLRRNVQSLHPDLDLWMVVDGYGKTLSRPGLDLMRRELCSIAMLIPQNAPRQLLSHLKGALNAGATSAQVDGVLEIAGAVPVPEGYLEIARGLWQELKDTLLHD
jgi:4-carboxymuconolactone decarboxylase